ncbi:anti-phage-associated helicase HerA [Eggerthella sinensis]|uniref:anti-phage-associated helicase HerA n=1 Tax=Eggerthella sinensis TaxID=242230 RepID=UPI001D06465D|nr:anti-phage-associated helicase HerA [Eggerthella sinensis]MCB7038348.1 ATP-binding protein [Eggerthella sinensis]
MKESSMIEAEVTAVYPDRINIAVDNLDKYNDDNSTLKIGSYVRISDNDNAVLIAMIDSFSISLDSKNEKRYVLEAVPLGLISGEEFERGGDAIAIPPKRVEAASADDILKIYSSNIGRKSEFAFSSLSSNREIAVPVDGNKFFSKHIAVVGSTGSGKSNTVSTIIQKAVAAKNGEFELNNTHVVIFDIHSEYKEAFPGANFLSIENLLLPYWLFNSEELEEILLDTGERDNYNQSSVFRMLVTANKKMHNQDAEKVSYDTPLYFDIIEVCRALKNIKSETRNAKAPSRIMVKDGTCDGLSTSSDSGIEWDQDERLRKYFLEEVDFYETKNMNITKGSYADGTLDKFVSRFEAKISDERLDFLFGSRARETDFESVLSMLMGYANDAKSNVTVIDLSGVPFEVLSITVSLISRMLFEYGYYYKRLRSRNCPDESVSNDVPLLLIYEEAHKYAPKSDLTKYRSSLKAIERIAKEGRKYGVTLLLASQRPSEISETIFSQCNNFIAMRLTNPTDQAYVKRLLPDTLGNLVNKTPSLRVGEALIVGDAISLPSVVQIDSCENPPSSSDIPYWDLWREEWKNLNISQIKTEWQS